MLRVFVSTRLERLGEPLARSIELERKIAPLRAPRIAVPSKLIEVFAKLKIAEATGIAANLRIEDPEQALAARVEQATPGLRVLTKEQVRALVADMLLRPEELIHPDLEPLRAYLAAVEEGPARATRIHQLSRRLGDLFHTYASSRRAMIEGWWKNQSLTRSLTEAWERRLWCAIFDEEGTAVHGTRSEEPSGVHRWQLLRDAFDRADLERLRLAGPLHVFGLVEATPSLLAMLRRLATATEVCVYAFTPCNEFWEDVDRSASDDTAALRLWGRPGRELIRALSEAKGGDLISLDAVQSSLDADRTEAKSTVLARLQDTIRRRVPTLPASEVDPERVPASDRSITILSCSSIRREAESVAGEIWRLVRESDAAARSGNGERVRFHEIAVLIPEPSRERYLAHLTAAFRDLFEIPYAIVDQSLAAVSRVAVAIDMLIELPLGSFTRDELLRLMIHPVVAGRYPRANPQRWSEWADGLNVLFGQNDGNLEGTYLADTDVVSWEQGLRRLVLGAFMTGDRSGDGRIYTWGGRSYLPFEIDRSEIDSIAAFVQLARLLLDDATWCRTASLPLSQWAAYFEHAVATYIHPQTEDDERAIVPCVEALNALVQHDVTQRPVPYRVAASVARETLAELERGKGQPLADGVTIGSFVPGRMAPFKCVITMGMGEGQFPVPTPQDPLDLHAITRLPSDISPGESQRYLFLESLMSARQRRVISYVRQHPSTGEPAGPSGVVVELGEMLRAGPGAAHTVEVPEGRHEAALAAWSASSGASDVEEVDLLPVQALREAQALALRRSIEPSASAEIDENEASARLGASWSKVRERLRLPEIPDALHLEHEPVVTLSLGLLRRFLECPLQGAAQVKLGLQEDAEEDPMQRDEETLEAGQLERLMLLREAFWAGNATLADVYQAHDHIFDRAALAGDMPAGIFSQAERRRHRQVIDAWCNNAHALVIGGVSGWSALHVGRAPEGERVQRLVPPITLSIQRDGQPVKVQIFGPTDPLSLSGDASMVLAMSDTVSARHRLRALVMVLALAATTGSTADIHRAFINPASTIAPDSKESKAATTLIRIPSREEALAYLHEIVTDLFDGTHTYLMPVEVVEKFIAERSGKSPRSIAEIVGEFQASGRPGWSSQYGPIKRLERFGPPTESHAMSILARRYEPLFSMILSSLEITSTGGRAATRRALSSHRLR